MTTASAAVPDPASAAVPDPIPAAALPDAARAEAAPEAAPTPGETATGPTQTPAPLVIDTDTAADDCFALLAGLLDERVELRAITIVAGNVGFEQQVHNALLSCEVAGRFGEVPVHRGAERPLRRERVGAEEVHGDGVGGLRLARPERPVSPEPAVDALLRLSLEHAGELVIAAIGPLTNLALAVQADPGFAGRVARLVVMGGSAWGRGNVTPAAEYNIYVDPEAAAIVFDAGFADLAVVPWAPLTIEQACLDAGDLAAIEALGTELARFFITANRASYEFDVGAGLAGSTHPDLVTALIAIDPSFAVTTSRHRVSVETASALTLGLTVFDWRHPEPNATLVDAIDRERLLRDLHALLARR